MLPQLGDLFLMTRRRALGGVAGEAGNAPANLLPVYLVHRVDQLLKLAQVVFSFPTLFHQDRKCRSGHRHLDRVIHQRSLLLYF